MFDWNKKLLCDNGKNGKDVNGHVPPCGDGSVRMEGCAFCHRTKVDEEVIAIYDKGNAESRQSSMISVHKGTSDDTIEGNLI